MQTMHAAQAPPPGVANMRPGDWMCPSCKCAPPCAPRSAPPSLPHTVASGAPFATRPNPASLRLCSNHNYADKIRCNRCKMPKLEAPWGGAPPGPSMSNMRVGDWMCRACAAAPLGPLHATTGPPSSSSRAPAPLPPATPRRHHAKVARCRGGGGCKRKCGRLSLA